jgi:hypothetical protein
MAGCVTFSAIVWTSVNVKPSAVEIVRRRTWVPKIASRSTAWRAVRDVPSRAGSELVTRIGPNVKSHVITVFIAIISREIGSIATSRDKFVGRSLSRVWRLREHRIHKSVENGNPAILIVFKRLHEFFFKNRTLFLAGLIIDASGLFYFWVSVLGG